MSRPPTATANKTLGREVLLLLRPKWLAVRNRYRFRQQGALIRSLFLLGLIVGFWLVAYFLLSSFLYQFKILEEFGEILPGKLLSMAFLFLLGVLMWSSLLTSFGVFFLSEDLQLIKSAPVSEDAFYISRLIETIIDSSWMVVLFVMPIFVAYGVVFEGTLTYYLVSIAALLSFVVIPCVLGIALTMLLVNVFPAQRAKDVLMLVSLIFFAGLIFTFRVLRPERLLDPESFSNMVEFFDVMRAPLSPLLPSQWASESIVSFIVGTEVYDPFWLGMLVISAMAAVVLGMWVSSSTHRYGFTKTQEVRRSRLTRSPMLDRLIGLYSFFFPRQLKEIISKDVKTFVRDITQWSQMFLLMALVVIYVYNFRVLPQSAGSYFLRINMINFVAFFNLGLSGAVVAAVALRFVFPAVSLEGRAFWLIRSSPLGLKGFLWSKYWISFFPLLFLGETLIVLTNLLLDVHPVLMWVGVVTNLLLVVGITSLGIGVGAVHPKFHWENVSKIPSGFGGIVFMVLAMSFIAVILVIEARPVYGILLTLYGGQSLTEDQIIGALINGFFVLLLCVLCFVLPMVFGLQRLEEREVW
jgi:ABC-2 type transport system permease protein